MDIGEEEPAIWVEPLETPRVAPDAEPLPEDLPLESPLAPASPEEVTA